MLSKLISIGYLCQYIPSRKSSPSAYKQNSREKDGYLTIEVMRLAAGTIPADENGPNGLTALRGIKKAC